MYSTQIFADGKRTRSCRNAIKSNQARKSVCSKPRKYEGNGGGVVNGPNEKGLLEVLIQRGLVPSFAFPLDVCTFTVRESGEGETKLTVNTSQDMRVALNSFVPGNYLTIDKKTYLSHGMTRNNDSKQPGIDYQSC